MSEETKKSDFEKVQNLLIDLEINYKTSSVGNYIMIDRKANKVDSTGVSYISFNFNNSDEFENLELME